MADHIATAADYADAIMVARRAKNLFVWLLLLVLLIQITIFLIARFTGIIGPSTAATQPTYVEQGLAYLTGLTVFIGIALTLVLAMVLLLIVKIMLVGRLIGVARVTSAYIWTLVLIVLLFPWQAMLDPYFFKIPGALYTWEELTRDIRFPNELSDVSLLKWARFAGFPIAAVIILLIVQVKSVRGVRQALGEAGPRINSPPIA